LSLYTLWFTLTSLAPFRHERHIREIDRLIMLGLLDMESGQRGYLLTNDAAFLKQYRTGEDIVRQFVPVLNKSLGDPNSKLLFSRLERLVNLKLEEMSLTVRLHDDGNPAAAINIVRNRSNVEFLEEYDDLRFEIRNNERQKGTLFEALRLPNEYSIRFLQ
jgi:CHASE3 domain sensor protein